MAYIPPTMHVTLLASLRLERTLPVPGGVTVQPGERVESVQVVAQAIIPDEHRLLDVGRTLSVSNDTATAAMIKKDGERVKKGEPIAVHKTFFGLARREVRSPVDGTLVIAGDGKALLAAISKPFEVRAGVLGTVASLIEDRGVVIELTGALLEGVWGNGREAFAVMRVVGSGPQEALLPEHVEMGLRGAILAVGSVQEASVFKQLTDTAIRGLIVGNLKSDLIPVVQKWDIPVLVTDGFGTQGFSLPVYNLLASNNGREAWVDARAWDRFAGGRPQAVIPLPGPGQTPPAPVDGQALQVGKRVRIVRGPQAGQAGTVIGLSDRPLPTPSGLRLRVAAVELEENRTESATVPFANLVILE